jgi:hypothetical protein
MAALTIGDARLVVMHEQTIGVAGADITAGMPCYEDPTDATLKPANAGAAGTSKVRGLALSTVQEGLPLTVLVKGEMDIGADTLDGLAFSADVFLGTEDGGLDDTGVGQNVKVGTVIAGWASRPPDRLLRVDL